MHSVSKYRRFQLLRGISSSPRNSAISVAHAQPGIYRPTNRVGREISERKGKKDRASIGNSIQSPLALLEMLARRGERNYQRVGKRVSTLVYHCLEFLFRMGSIDGVDHAEFTFSVKLSHSL